MNSKHLLMNVALMTSSLFALTDQEVASTIQEKAQNIGAVFYAKFAKAEQIGFLNGVLAVMTMQPVVEFFKTEPLLQHIYSPTGDQWNLYWQNNKQLASSLSAREDFFYGIMKQLVFDNSVSHEMFAKCYNFFVAMFGMYAENGLRLVVARDRVALIENKKVAKIEKHISQLAYSHLDKVS